MVDLMYKDEVITSGDRLKRKKEKEKEGGEKKGEKKKKKLTRLGAKVPIVVSKRKA